MIIFDLDGTLWDSTKTLMIAWTEEIVKQTGKQPSFSLEKLKSTLGMTMNEIADHLVPELPDEERYRVFRHCEKTENDYILKYGGELFPMEREILAELKASGRKLAIVSNCQEGYISAFLESMKMQEFFCDYEEWGRTGLSKGENIRLVMERNSVEKAIYIGDIQRDADACAEAGVPCIWAKYGFGHIEKPDGIIERFADLPIVLEKLGY